MATETALISLKSTVLMHMKFWQALDTRFAETAQRSPEHNAVRIRLDGGNGVVSRPNAGSDQGHPHVHPVGESHPRRDAHVHSRPHGDVGQSHNGRSTHRHAPARCRGRGHLRRLPGRLVHPHRRTRIRVSHPELLVPEFAATYSALVNLKYKSPSILSNLFNIWGPAMLPWHVPMCATYSTNVILEKVIIQR